MATAGIAVLVNRRRAYRLKPGIDLLAMRAQYPNKQIEHILEPWPEQEQLEEWVMDSVCEATDGCTVEPDGTCSHGYPSWLLALGVM